MNGSTSTANIEPIVSRNSIREAHRRALRLFVGRGRRYSVKELANGSGVPDRVIECAMCDVDSEDYRPLPHEALSSITKFLGASFASIWLESCGLGAFELMDGQIPLPKVLAPATPDETQREKITRLSNELSAAVEALPRQLHQEPPE